jgi:predicted ATP-dependent endonuclease of OLD family
MKSLRYFRRLPARCRGAVPVSTVVNRRSLRQHDQTERFVRRYLSNSLRSFFADGAVLVEGPAERLVPHLRAQ